MTCIRFPHSAISGSFLVLRSPKLIAESYGLHRYWLSRHPLSVPLITFLCIDITSNRSSIWIQLQPSTKIFSSLIQIVNQRVVKNYFGRFKATSIFLAFFTICRGRKGDLLNFPHYIAHFLPCQHLFSTFFIKFLPFSPHPALKT